MFVTVPPPAKSVSSAAILRTMVSMVSLVSLVSPLPVLIVLMVILLGGCAGLTEQAGAPGAAGMPDFQVRQAAQSSPSLQSSQASRAAAEAESARLNAVRAQSVGEPQYLRFKADDTELTAAQDDGRLTYLEFASPLSAQTEFFDQDGRPLRTAVAGRVVAIDGVHAGILVRRADRASFASPNPRALSLPRGPLPDSADHAEARAMLESQADQMQAMRRAVEAARSSSSPPRPVIATTPALLPPSISSAQFPFAPGVSSRPSTLPRIDVLNPASTLATASERGLVRVFFATASRAIVAPDDGLALLLREAANADEIRVTGFTDATGSHATNDVLALARADAVLRILLRRGIPAQRIVSNGIGAAGFIADNASEKGRALNRRVDVLMLRDGLPIAFGGTVRAMR